MIRSFLFMKVLCAGLWVLYTVFSFEIITYLRPYSIPTYKLVVIYLNTLANYHLPNTVISLASYIYRKWIWLPILFYINFVHISYS